MMDADEMAGRFAGRLRELRAAKGWTQPELAERTGLSKGGIADFEQGRRMPSWETIIRLCLALGVECGEFQKKPADVEAPGRGRPAKEVEKPKRGRPKGKGK